jgi:serine/threonine-protein kinase HipA
MLSRETGIRPTELSPTSLAGIQPKVGLYLDTETGGWYRSAAGGPTTHIIKLGSEPGTPLADIIDTEAACMALARAMALTTAQAHIEHLGTVRALVVSRYDRIRQIDGTVIRVHQEDSAQALGINTNDMNRKFQRGRALPSLAKIADVLREGGSEPDPLLALTTFNVAIGNTDAHAKNISILRPPDAPATLAPAYDVAMHGHLTSQPGRFAMEINGTDDLAVLTAEDLVAEGTHWGLPRRRAARVVRDTLASLDGALTNEPRDAHPGVSERAWQLVEERTRMLSRDATRIAD